MAKKRSPRTPQPGPTPTPTPTPRPEAHPPPPRSAVTADRFTRLYRLLAFLADEPRSRDRLTRELELDVRGFYRDLELLRAADIVITLNGGQYGLEGGLEDAVDRLPFPDPHLTLGEARQLARGRSRAHAHLRGQIDLQVP